MGSQPQPFQPGGTGVFGRAAFASSFVDRVFQGLQVFNESKFRQRQQQLKLLQDTLGMMLEGPAANKGTQAQAQIALERLQKGDDVGKVSQSLFELDEEAPPVLGAEQQAAPPTIVPGAAPEPLTQVPGAPPSPSQKQALEQGPPSLSLPALGAGAAAQQEGVTAPALPGGQGNEAPVAPATSLAPTAAPGGPAGPAPGLGAEPPALPFQQVPLPVGQSFRPPTGDVGTAVSEAEQMVPQPTTVQRLDPTVELGREEQRLAGLERQRAQALATLEQMLTPARTLRNKLGLTPISEVKTQRDIVQYTSEVIQQSQELIAEFKQAIFQADRQAAGFVNDAAGRLSTEAGQTLRQRRTQGFQRSERQAEQSFKTAERVAGQEFSAEQAELDRGEDTGRTRQALEQGVLKETLAAVQDIAGEDPLKQRGATTTSSQRTAQVWADGLVRLGVDLESGAEILEVSGNDVKGEIAELIAGAKSGQLAPAEALVAIRSIVAAALRKAAQTTDETERETLLQAVGDPRKWFRTPPALLPDVAALVGG